MQIARSLLCLLTLGFASGEAVAAQREVEQTFAVQPGTKVVLDTYRGSINVAAGADDVVRVYVSLDILNADPAQARAMLDGFTLDAVADDGTVRLTARNPRDSGVRFTWERTMRPEIAFTVTVPEHCHLDLQTKDGSITVGTLRGNMRARGESGTIFFRQIDGTVDAATQAGDVVVSRCTGAVNLRTNQGNIRIGTVGGRARLVTVNGDIEVMAAYGAVDAATTAGDVTAGFASMPEASRIKSSLGNIHATVNPTEGFALLAAAGWGKVTSKIDLTEASGRTGRSKLAGQFQAGGPLLELRTGSGNVRIELGEPLFQL